MQKTPTSNDPTALPSEFKRKGRFDENFFVDLPNATERLQILKIHLHRFGCCLDDGDVEAIASSTEQFSGSELENLVAEAATIAFDQNRPQKLTLADLESSRSSITPLAVQDAASIQLLREWASTPRSASTNLDPTNSPTLKTARLRI